MSQCSRGWALRCPKAKNQKCRCSCGGENHGRRFLAVERYRAHAHYRYEEIDPQGTIIIRDVGPWDRFPTVTNDIEEVVRRVLSRCPNAKRLFYYDSDNDFSEIVFENATFKKFMSAPKENYQ